MLGVDIAGAGSRCKEWVSLRHQLYLPFLAATAKIKGRRTFLDEGDGGVAIMPPAVTALYLAQNVIPYVARKANQRLQNPMRLRFMIHRGEVIEDEWGYRGKGLELVFRTLQAEQLKQYHDRVAKSLAIVAVSSHMYREIPENTWDGLIIRNKDTRALTWTRPIMTA